MFYSRAAGDDGCEGAIAFQAVKIVITYVPEIAAWRCEVVRIAIVNAALAPWPGGFQALRLQPSSTSMVELFPSPLGAPIEITRAWVNSSP